MGKMNIYMYARRISRALEGGNMARCDAGRELWLANSADACRRCCVGDASMASYIVYYMACAHALAISLKYVYIFACLYCAFY